MVLDQNIFNTTEKLTNINALGQTIQNLLIIEPGTYPNQPLLGVGIENYEFEFLDNNTISEIQERITNQVKTFIPSSYYNIEFNVKTIKNDFKDNILIIEIKVFEGNIGSSFKILVGKNKVNKKVISKMVF